MLDYHNAIFVENSIRNAFPMVPFPADAVLRPDSRRDKPSFLGRNWWDVEFVEAAQQAYFTFNFTISEAVYYCPLMLISALREPIGAYDDYFDRFFFLSEDVSLEGQQSYFPDARERINRDIANLREKFDVKQRRSIAYFFSYLGSLHHSSASQTLKNYWGQFLCD